MGHSKLIDSLAEANSWVVYIVSLAIATAGSVVDKIMKPGSTDMDMQAVADSVIITATTNGKLFVWGFALTELLYVIVLCVTIVASLVKLCIDLSTWLEKREDRRMDAKIALQREARQHGQTSKVKMAERFTIKRRDRNRH